MKETTVGSAVLIAGTIVVSSLFAVLKSLDDVPPLLRASWRLQTTFLALAVPSGLAVYLRTQSCRRKSNQDAESNGQKDASTMNQGLPMLHAVSFDSVRAGCGWALYNIGLCYAVSMTSLIRSTILSQCAPIFIVFHQFLQTTFPQLFGEATERVHWKHIAGVVLAIVGTTVFVISTKSQGEQRNNDNKIVGDLWGAFASAGYAMYCTFGQKARRSTPIFAHMPICCFTAMAIVSVAAWMSQQSDDAPGQPASNPFRSEETYGFCQEHLLGWTCPEYFPRMIYVGVVCGAIAVTMVNWSMSKVQVLEAATANSSEPVFATIIGVVFFGEPMPNIVAVAAAAIIVHAMILCSAQGEKVAPKLKVDNLREEGPIGSGGSIALGTV